ncbi:MAG: TIGR03086 family metal-binding protein [Kineosporiaceae bacterium]
MAMEKTVLLPVPPEEAFALVTEPERLRRWLAVTARLELHAGGRFRWALTPMAAASGTVVEVEPGRRLVLDFAWEHASDASRDTVVLTLEPAEGGTLVRLEHRTPLDDPAKDAGHLEGWSHFLDRLRLAAATGDAGPDEWVAAPAVLTPLTSASATLAVLQHVLRDIGPEAAGLQTACRDFTVAELEAHVVESMRGLTTFAGATFTTATEGTLEARVADIGRQAVEAWTARGLDGTVLAGGAEHPAPVIAGIMSLEFLVHAWDFAAALGRKVLVSDEVAAYVLGLAHQVINPDLRVTAGFDEALPIADDAPPLDRLLAFTGRAA